MIITEIETNGFRNLSGALKCTAGINILCGDNAQGKTNWLEAIYLLGNTKSFRTAILRETIAFGIEAAKEAFVRGAVRRENLDKELQIHLTENSKSFYINGKREAVTRYLGNLDVIIFSADEMQIVRGEPSERRRFLDRGIMGLSPAYLKTLSEYNRILKQKNILLKEAQESSYRSRYLDLIEAWNEQLLEYATEIHRLRVDYTRRLQVVLSKKLFSDRVIDIHYRSSLTQHGWQEEGTPQQYRQLLASRLKLRLDNEISSGYALVGPHRDELEILIEGLEASKFGSSGEQRSALLTLDLAQMEVYYLAFEEYPVFLLDDIDAELDARRIARLLDHIAGKMQVFISTSKRAIATKYQHLAACKYIETGRILPASSADRFMADEFDEQAIASSPVLKQRESPLIANQSSRSKSKIDQEILNSLINTLPSVAEMVESDSNVAPPILVRDAALVAAEIPPLEEVEEYVDIGEDKHRAPF